MLNENKLNHEKLSFTFYLILISSISGLYGLYLKSFHIYSMILYNLSFQLKFSLLKLKFLDYWINFQSFIACI